MRGLSRAARALPLEPNEFEVCAAHFVDGVAVEGHRVMTAVSEQSLCDADCTHGEVDVEFWCLQLTRLGRAGQTQMYTFLDV